jgi:hypothetical protein
MSRKAAWIRGGLALLILLALLLVLRSPLSREEYPGGSRSSGDKAGAQSYPADTAGADTTPGKRRSPSKRRERVSLQEILAKGFTLEADEIGPTSAKGNIRLKFPGNVEITADRLWVSADGDLVAEGKLRMMPEKGTSILTSDNGSLTLRYDEEKGAVTVNAAEGMTFRPKESADLGTE